MITDEQVEAALDYMRDNADRAAQAAADVISAEEAVKTQIAMASSASKEKSEAAREREARLTHGVQQAIAGRVAAVYADRKMRLLYAAAEARIQAWQTQSANARATRI